MNTTKLKNLILGSVITGGLIIGGFAGAQTQGEEIPQNLQPLAKELGCSTKAECSTAFEQNFEHGLELAEKYNAYANPEQKKLAESYKKEVISKLSSIKDENVEEEIVKIAREILSKNKDLAKKLAVTNENVRAAETIVTEIKNAGGNLDLCSKPANSLSKEDLIICFEASKQLSKKAETIQTYISKESIAEAEAKSKSLSLDEALRNGEYPELGKTPEEAGTKCLRAGSEAITACDDIARKFFGEEGVKELVRARAETKQAEEFYKKGVENLSLQRPTGETIVGKDAIRKACDTAFQNKDVASARACGDFAVKNGFTTREEADRGLTLLQSVTSVSQVNLNACSQNPEACKNYIPDDYRKEYEAKKKIYEAISQEAGLKPEDCRRAPFDSSIGRRCVEASKRIIPNLKIIAGDLSEAERLVGEIEIRTQKGEEYAKRAGEFTSVLKAQGGPGGCRTEAECSTYCSDPKNGAECISFGTKFQVFSGEEGVQRYTEYNRRYTTPTPQPAQEDEGSRYTYPYPTPNPYPYPNPNRPIAEPYYSPRPGYPGGGISPECYAAIQSGDFVQAKTVCVTTKPYPQPIQPPQPTQCPIATAIYLPCSEGTYRETKYSNGCPSFGECIAIPGYQPKPEPIKGVCPALPTVSSCSDGQDKIISYSSPECGTYYSCKARETKSTWTNHTWYLKDGNKRTSSILPRTDREYLDYIALVEVECRTKITTDTFNWKVGAGNDNPDNWQNFGIPECSGGTVIEDPAKTYPGDTNSCPGFANSRWDTTGKRYCQLNTEERCDYNYPSYLTNGGNYVATNCPKNDWQQATSTTYSSCSASLTSLLGAGCHFMYSDSSGRQTYCNSGMTQSAKEGDTAVTQGCPNSPSSQTNTTTSVVTTTTTTPTPVYECTADLKDQLGTGCHYMGNAYFDNTMTRYVIQGERYAKQCYSNYIQNCTTGTPSTGTCPSGQTWYTPSGGGAGYCVNSTQTTTQTQTQTGTTSGNYGACGSYVTQSSCTGATNCYWFSDPTSPYCYYSSSGGASGSGTCSASLISLLGTGCHYMYNDSAGQPIYCNSGMTQSAKDRDTAITAGCSGNALPTYSSGSSCPSGQYWNGTSCVTNTTTYTGSGSCSASLTSLLGTGCHFMYNDSSERPTYCNSGMTQSAKEGDTAITQGCSGGGYSSTSTSCPSGQYWNGTSCVNTSSEGTTSGGTTYSSDPATACSQAGGSWNASSNYCQMPSSGGTTGSCTSGQYWNGTSCVNTSTTDCPSGQYWNGSACAPTSSSLNPRYMMARLNHLYYKAWTTVQKLLDR